MLASLAASRALKPLLHQVVQECCTEKASAAVTARRLVGRLREGLLSEAGLLALLTGLQEESPSSCPAGLLALLTEQRTGTGVLQGEFRVAAYGCGKYGWRGLKNKET